jgi:hypothetical protein
MLGAQTKGTTREGRAFKLKASDFQLAIVSNHLTTSNFLL